MSGVGALTFGRTGEEIPFLMLLSVQGPSQAKMVVGGCDQHLATIPWLLGTEKMGNRAPNTFSLTLLDLFSNSHFKKTKEAQGCLQATPHGPISISVAGLLISRKAVTPGLAGAAGGRSAQSNSTAGEPESQVLSNGKHLQSTRLINKERGKEN